MIFTSKIIKIILSLILVLSIILQCNISNAAATSTKVGYVSINSGSLNVRSGPGTNYTVIGSLKNNASVTVYSQSKDGWSQIAYKKKRAYVSSQYLRMYSFLKDTKKIYTYYAPQEGTYEKFSYKGTYNGWQNWASHTDGYTIGLKEDNSGLYTSYPESEIDKNLGYPLKIGTEWIVMEVKFKITSINGTLKTRAGTFNKVVTVKSEGGSTSYYAPNVGLIKIVDGQRTTYELTSLVKKK